jgi:hypothetical protein
MIRGWVGGFVSISILLSTPYCLKEALLHRHDGTVVQRAAGLLRLSENIVSMRFEIVSVSEANLGDSRHGGENWESCRPISVPRGILHLA